MASKNEVPRNKSNKGCKSFVEKTGKVCERLIKRLMPSRLKEQILPRHQVSQAYKSKPAKAFGKNSTS